MLLNRIKRKNIKKITQKYYVYKKLEYNKYLGCTLRFPECEI